MPNERAGDLVRGEGEWAVILVLKSVGDPLRRQGLPAREPDYRLRLALKRFLRDYGLKCENVQSGDVNSEHAQ